MKKLLSTLLVVGILFSSGIEPNIAYAQKSSSSKPSSGSSSSKPSGGSSSSKPSYSGGGKGYSSGNKPSYSGGSSPPSSKPSTPSSPPSASGTGGKSYTGGSSSPPKVSPPSKTPSVPVAPKPINGSNGNSYTSGNKVYSPVNPSSSSKPKGGAFDGNAAQAKAREESKKSYIKGAEPKSTYTTPAGKEAKINTNSKSVTTIRNMSHTTYVTRETRIYSTYGSYYSRPVVVFADPYPSLFWWWLLDRSLEERAMWAYHHQHEMDTARYREMCAKDAQLEARIRQLEAQNKGVRDVSYTPKGIDPDLQYSDDYVDAVYNPHTEHDVTKNSGESGLGNICYYFFLVLLIGSIIGFAIWFVFMKNWKN